LRVALLDKAGFPRDKVCGDAIGGRVISVLNRIDPAYSKELEIEGKVNRSTSWTLYSPEGRSVSMTFTKPGYISRRTDFDNFLLDLVRRNTQVSIMEEFPVNRIEKNGSGLNLFSAKGQSIQSRLLIACDGAHSVSAKQLADFRVDMRHYSGAVRAYFNNISNFSDSNALEIHLLKEHLPGYFWIFPLSATSANVGFGMLSSDISKRKINLKNVFREIITQAPGIAERFKNACQEGEIEGFGLPLGGVQRRISGSNYMLCGDAASLIDPLNGEGIGNAMWSGYLAGMHARKCFEANDFSGEFMRAYDQSVYSKLGKELRSKLYMQKIFNREWLINFLVRMGQKNSWLKNKIARKL